VRELHRQGVAIELRDLPWWSPATLPAHLRDPWFDSLDKPTRARTVLHFCMPHQVVRDVDRLNVNYTMFEATHVHPSWIRHNDQHDLVIVPTESSKQAWIQSGLRCDRLRICPLGINPEIFSGSAVPVELRLATGPAISSFRTRFLNVSTLAPRKNLVGLLRTWIAATRSGDDAVLVIKTGGYLPAWRAAFEEQTDAAERQVGKSLREAAPVHLFDELLSDADMAPVYAAATHYVSLSFGEGWDQPMVEAAVSGLRLIAPNHSAYRAYLDSSVARLINCREVRAVFPGDRATAALFAHANWWAPDEDEAAACIRAAIDGRDVVQASPRDRILRDFTWEKATSRLIALLTELEHGKKRRWFVPGLRRNRPAPA
jgi:glycosyltransferase involved in cell wall biosynthesis